MVFCSLASLTPAFCVAMASLIAVTSSSARMWMPSSFRFWFSYSVRLSLWRHIFRHLFRSRYLYRSAFPEYPIFAFLALQELGEVALRQHGGAAELFEGQPHCSLYFCLYLILLLSCAPLFLFSSVQRTSCTAPEILRCARATYHRAV